MSRAVSGLTAPGKRSSRPERSPSRRLARREAAVSVVYSIGSHLSTGPGGLPDRGGRDRAEGGEPPAGAVKTLLLLSHPAAGHQGLGPVDRDRAGELARGVAENGGEPGPAGPRIAEQLTAGPTVRAADQLNAPVVLICPHVLGR